MFVRMAGREREAEPSPEVKHEYELVTDKPWPDKPAPGAAMPTRVQVGPFRYTVTEDIAVIHAANVQKRGVYAGVHEYEECRIALDPRVGVEHKRETLLRELLHALFDLTGIARQMEDSEEDVVRRLSPMLLDTLRRNPALVAYLTEGK